MLLNTHISTFKFISKSYTSTFPYKSTHRNLQYLHNEIYSIYTTKSTASAHQCLKAYNYTPVSKDLNLHLHICIYTTMRRFISIYTEYLHTHIYNTCIYMFISAHQSLQHLHNEMHSTNISKFTASTHQ